MKTIILPGYSPRNREWADDLAAAIPGAEVHPWPHWNTGGSLDAARELASILRRIGGETVHLLAKSVGCGIALRVVLHDPGRVSRLILCGLPGISAEARAGLAGAAAVLAPERILVVQNRADPYAACAEVKKIVQNLAPGIRVTEGDRDDHHYPYHEIFTAFLET